MEHGLHGLSGLKSIKISENQFDPCNPCSIIFLSTTRKNLCKNNLKNTLFYAEKRLKNGTFAH